MIVALQGFEGKTCVAEVRFIGPRAGEGALALVAGVAFAIGVGIGMRVVVVF